MYTCLESDEMATSTTMTIRLDPQLKAKLGRLADVEAGRTVSHTDAMASLRQVIDAAADNAA